MQNKTDYKKVDLRLAVVDEPPLNGEPVYIKCINPNHKEKTASCAVFFDHIHCFACGFDEHGRVEGLALLLNIDLREAFRRGRWYTSEGLDAYRERRAVEARKDPLPKSIAAGYHSLLMSPSRINRLSWYESRDIPYEWIDRAALGHDGEKFTIPIWDADKNLLNIRFRRDDEYCILPDENERPVPKYSGMRGRNGTYFYPEWLFVQDGRDWCCVTEGELDALRLWVDDIPAISPTNGASSVKQVVSFLQAHPRIKHVYVVTDQDAPGDKAAAEFMGLARDFEYVERVVWDAQFKDVTELLNHNPAALDWIAEREERLRAC